MRFLKGWFGELKTAFNMWLSLDSKTYQKFHGLIIPAPNGTTQIDHVLVSDFGIFIVETKNKSGWIFGSKDQIKWTQTFYGKKYSFQNPLRQTYRQKKVLAQFLSVSESYIHPIVYFVGDCKFKTELPENVIRTGLGRYIKQFQDPVISYSEKSRILSLLERHLVESNLTSGDHLRSLKERHGSTTVCPNCGASLKLRRSRRGPSAGSNFYGCETYPKCRFTRSA